MAQCLPSAVICRVFFPYLPSARVCRVFSVELPSVRIFAECFLVRHSANREFARVSESLPSVFSLALGKDMVCRVSDKIHSAKNMTLDKSFDSGSDVCVHVCT